MATQPKDEASLLVTRAHGLRIRAIDEKARTAEFVASTDAIDSYDEVVEQSWDLSRFKDNPIILYGHDRWGLPIGKAIRCEVVQEIGGPRLECTIEFATAEMNPLAEQVWQLVKAEMLRAVSVGFRPRNVKYEKRNGKDIYVLSDNLLLEISVVTIPANPEALAKADDALERVKQDAKARQGLVPDSRGQWHPPVTTASERQAPEPTTVPAPGTQEKTTMTEQEMKAAIEKAEAAQKAAEADATDAKKRAEDTANAALQADARAKAAEERAAGLEASNAGLTETVTKSLAALGGPRKKAGSEDVETLVDVAERVAGELVEREVDALVDTKILPAEKADFVELAKTNRPLFERMVAQRADHGLLKPVVKGAKLEPSTASGASDDGAEFARAIEDEADAETGEFADLADAINDDES